MTRRCTLLSVGIGCRRGTGADRIAQAVQYALDLLPRERAAAFDAVIGIATVARKADEPGLLLYCAQKGLSLRGFSVAALQAIDRPHLPGETSTRVQIEFGIDRICERAALCALPGSTLIVPKQTLVDVTVAIAVLAILA